MALTSAMAAKRSDSETETLLALKVAQSVNVALLVRSHAEISIVALELIVVSLCRAAKTSDSPGIDVPTSRDRASNVPDSSLSSSLPSSLSQSRSP